MTAGDAVLWNSMSDTLDNARFAVWSLPEEKWDATTRQCVDYIHGWLPPEPSALLDVGCGIGRLTFPFATAYPQATVYGWDVAEGMLAHARALDTEDRVQWLLGDGRNIPLDSPIDAAWTVVVFQHNPRDVCADIVRSVGEHLVPGGRFIFQVVSDRDITDETHLAPSVPAGWCDDAGLQVVNLTHSVVFPDWLWVVAEKP